VAGGSQAGVSGTGVLARLRFRAKKSGVAEISLGADSALRDLANAFCVSREVILRRMLTLGWTTYTFYRRKRAQFIEEAQLRGSKGGFISPAARAIRSAGPEFVRVVMSAYDREEITGNDLSEYLGVKIRHVPKVREMAFHGSRYRAETAAQHKV